MSSRLRRHILDRGVGLTDKQIKSGKQADSTVAVAAAVITGSLPGRA
jgi:hypothetical protein